jgi:hypothetical protein
LFSFGLGVAASPSNYEIKGTISVELLNKPYEARVTAAVAVSGASSLSARSASVLAPNRIRSSPTV